MAALILRLRVGLGEKLGPDFGGKHSLAETPILWPPLKTWMKLGEHPVQC